jgi:serine protease inhibitor
LPPARRPDTVLKRYREIAVVASLGLSGLALAGGGLVQGGQGLGQNQRAVAPAAVSALNRFSFDLFRHATTPGENACLSPVGVWFVLSHLFNGAAGETREALSKVLEVPDEDLRILNQTNRDLHALLTSAAGSGKVQLANSVWIRQGLDVRRDFEERMAQTYGASIRPLDFNSARAVETINDWIGKATDGRILNALDRLEPGEDFVLVNAVHFDMDWLLPFDKEETRARDFFLPGRTIQVPTMHAYAPLPSFEEDGVEGISIPYGGGGYAMLVILPPAGVPLDEFAAGLDGDRFEGWMASMKSRTLRVAMPKFETERRIDLKPVLEAMGLGNLFTSKVDLTSMIADPRAFVTRVSQSTFIRVDEEGTVASAATLLLGGLGGGSQRGSSRRIAPSSMRSASEVRARSCSSDW